MRISIDRSCPLRVAISTGRCSPLLGGRFLWDTRTIAVHFDEPHWITSRVSKKTKHNHAGNFESWHIDCAAGLLSCSAPEAFSAVSSNRCTRCCTNAANWGRQSGLLWLNQSRIPRLLTSRSSVRSLPAKCVGSLPNVSCRTYAPCNAENTFLRTISNLSLSPSSRSA